MLLMKIRKVKPDGNDYILSVPLSILPGLNADFDGDILNIIGMVDESISYMFRKFDKRFGSNTNPFNCWELLQGQSAAKTLI